MSNKKMNSILIILVLSLLGILSACGNSSNDVSSKSNESSDIESDELYEKIKEKGVIEAGSTPTGPPFTFLNPDSNEIEGMIVDIGNRVAEELNLELNLNSVPFTSLVPSIDRGSIDMVVAGLAYTEERAEHIDFSETIYSYGEVIVISEDNDEIKSFEDLEGKTVGVQEASTTYDELQNYPEINVQVYGTQQDMARDLGFGRLDAFLPDYPVYQNLVKESPALTEGFKFAPDHESQWIHNIGLGVPKGANLLLEDINKIIEQMKESGELDEIIAQWEIE